MVNKSNNAQLELHQVFTQANTIAGYRYLDLTGVVLNKISGFYAEYSVDPAGCLLKVPKDTKDPYAIRFAPDRIWLHYVPVDSLKYVADTAPEWITNIAKDLEVNRYSRLGMRSQFFKPCTDIVEAATTLSKNISGTPFQGIIKEVDDPLDVAFEYVIRIPMKQYIAGIVVTSVKITRAPINPSEFPSDGLLLDLDIYRRRQPPEGLHRTESPNFFKKASEITYELLEKIGYQLMGV